jgi:hypothetical protein
VKAVAEARISAPSPRSDAVIAIMSPTATPAAVDTATRRPWLIA